MEYAQAVIKLSLITKMIWVISSLVHGGSSLCLSPANLSQPLSQVPTMEPNPYSVQHVTIAHVYL